MIPVFYGETLVEDGTRAIVLSDVAGTPLALIPPSECNPEDVARMLETAIRAISAWAWRHLTPTYSTFL